MNRNLIIGIILVLVIGGGYYQFSYKPQREAEIAAAQKVAEEAAATAKKAEEEAAAAAKKAEEEAAAAAKKAEEEAAAAAKLAADAAAALDPAAWDAAKVNALIDGSALDDAAKTTLKAAVTAAGTDATAITAVIAQIKTALGIQ